MAVEPSESTGQGDAPPAPAPVTSVQPNIGDLGRFFFGPRSVASIAMTGVFLLGLIAFFYFAKAFLLPLILALLLSFLLKPVVNTVCRWGVPRAASALIVLILFIGLISTAVYRLNTPAKEWLAKAPESIYAIESRGREWISQVEGFLKRGRSYAEATETTPADPAAPVDPKRQLAWAEKLVSVGAILGYTAGFLAGSLETLVLLFFLLASGDLLLQKLVRVLPRLHEKKEAVEFAREVEQSISTFLFTITAINCGMGLIVALVMLLLGMPNPVLWGVLAALLNFIPYFGPLTMTLVLVLAGFLSFDSTLQAILPAVIFVVIHAIESNVLTPTVVGRRLTLSPVVIFVSLMFWTWLWGMPGALLSVPLLMTLKILCDHIRPLAPIGEFLST